MRSTVRLPLTLAAAVALAVPSLAVAQMTDSVFAGQPTFKEGKALGYFIWLDKDTWKLRWTTFGAAHKFSGRVVVVGGDVKSFKRIDVDVERRVIRPGAPTRVVRGPRGRVRTVRPGRAPVVATRTQDKIEQEDEHTVQWLTNTDDDIDGVDIKVAPGATGLRFNLLIDGKARPEELEVGKGNFKPGVNPVLVRLK